MKIFEEIKERVCDFIHEKNNSEAPCKNQIESCFTLIRLCDLARIINQVEEEHNNGWIPCSERLPEEYGEYLCCNKYGEFIVGYPIAKHSNDGFYVETNTEGLDFVIAWQPLPSPYEVLG